MYADETGLNFMDSDTFDQVSIQETMIENSDLLKEGMMVDVIYHAEKNVPLTVEMPQYIVLQVTYTEPGIKGDTATNASKPAKVETGAEIRVPLFINEGELIKIDTATKSYVERAKN